MKKSRPEKTSRPSVVVVLGPTSSGKTKLAVALAKKFNGEIISADSRQVYRGMDIGTGKDLSAYGRVPYHLIDIIDPRWQFSLFDYQRLAYQTIDAIIRRGKLPIICGGTGLYISAVVDGFVLAQAPPNKRLRARLTKRSLKQLLAELRKVDSATYRVVDKKNRRRVERALEIYYQAGVSKAKHDRRQKPPYDFLLLGVTLPKNELRRRIDQRLTQRLKQGMVREVSRLHRQGVSWRRLELFGLEYLWAARYLQGKISRQEMIEQLQKAIYHYAKRQMTWFKRDQRIVWIAGRQPAVKLLKNFV